jgi:regulator of protease activity HflC (stomatin/prohibitin superfamily)
MKSERGQIEAGVLLVILCIVAVGGGGCYMYPRYKVYEQTMAGQAKLREAESSRQIKTLEAKAALESADYLSKADIKRAEGVALANKIIGDSLKGNEAYLRYLWISSLDDVKGSVIYVPTEAGLPILEAGRGVKEGKQ